jgi:hypothetical protein
VALRTLLKFRNLDLTKDINDRFTRLFVPGVFDGGLIEPVSGQLYVEIVAPWKLVSKEGMVVEETSTNTRLAITTGQTTVVAVKVVYVQNNDPIIEARAIELTAFNMLVDKDYYVVFAHIVVPPEATLILDSYIQYANRDIVDKLGRSPLRGHVASVSDLPSAKDNIQGDIYIIADGAGGIPHIYGWDGDEWVILTDAATVTANLATHRQNLYDNEKHLTDNEKNALIGTSQYIYGLGGTPPSATNPFVDNADTRLPTQNENNALLGTDGLPSDTNRYITEEYPWAIPEEKYTDTPVITDTHTILYQTNTTNHEWDGPFYVGKEDNIDPVLQYFKLYDPVLNREYTTSTTHPTYPNAVVSIIGVYIDADLNIPLNPGLLMPNSGVDNDGFYTGDLYLKWDVTPDTDFIVLFAKRRTMKRLGVTPNFYHPWPNAIIRRRFNDAQVPASVIKAIEDIKGRDFDDTPPISERNTNLRGNVIGTKEWIGCVFKTDNVVSNFSEVENVPTFANDFYTNIGIPQDYTFENIPISSISYSYDLSTGEGTVTYGSVSVDLSSVVVNRDVFIDGSLNEYKVVSKNTSNRTIKIQKRNGKVPRAINTTTSLYGSFTSGSNVVTSVVPSTSGLVSNMAVKGSGIPSGTLIFSVDSPTQITLSNPATTTIPSSPFVAVPNTLVNNFYPRGSIKKDNNPRKINLATLDYLVGRKKILCKEIQPVLNEFHPTNGNVAYEITTPIRSATHREPRIRFYGGFKNRESGSRSRVVATNAGSILVTGFFTDLGLLVDLKNSGPSFTVKVDGDATGTVVTPSTTIAYTNGFNNELDLQQQHLLVASGLSDLVPHTVEIVVSDASNDFIIHGFDLFRKTVTDILMLSGRSFTQSDLYQKNSIQSGITLPRSGIGINYVRSKGLISTRYVNRYSVESTQNTTMFDMDGADDTTCPKGAVTNATPLFSPSTGLTKFSYYQANDIVKLIILDTSGNPYYEQILLISSITSGTATFSTSLSTNGLVSPQALLVHVASTTGDMYDSLREFNRYSIADLGVKQSSDFAYLLNSGTAGNRLFTLDDGTTAVSAYNVKYVSTGIDGADIALNMVDNTSRFRIKAVASQLDILVVNTSSVAGALISIDGSPTRTVSFSGNGLTKVTLWTNARYQSHEASITNASGLDIVGFIVYEPTHNVKIEGSLLATQNVIANYDSSLSTDGSIIPTGSISVDPYRLGGVFVNSAGVGTEWTNAIDFAMNQAWGRYIWTSKVGSYFEYTFIGGGFEIEYLASSDRRYAEVYIDNVLATIGSFPTATFKGINSATGRVDMYEASLKRRKFGISGITFRLGVVKVLCTADKNPASTDTGGINIGNVYEINNNGYLSYSPSKGFRGKAGIDDYVFGMDWVRDDRVFDTGFAIKEQRPSQIKLNSQPVVLQDVRYDKITLSMGELTKTITFTTPFEDSDYFVTCQIISDSGSTPVTVLPTGLTTTGFTAKFASISGAGYYLTYTATKYL